MKKHIGDLIAKPGVAYDYTEITGGLDARGADTKTAFPKLTTIGGWLDASGADTKTAFPKLTTIGGTLDARGADTKTAFPKLTTIGGTLYARGADTKTAFPKLKSPGDSGAALRHAFAAHGLTFDDGVLCHIILRRGSVARVRRVGLPPTAPATYLVTDGTHTAHGDTLAQARADLRLKQAQRDTTPYRAWRPSTVVSLEDGIAAYRAVTGACRDGVRDWLHGRALPSRLSVARILTETKGAYGHEAFASFVEAGK